MGDVYRFNTFDQIYDEHVFLLPHSIEKIANKFNLNTRLKMVSTHGGSMRYYVCRKGVLKNQMNVNFLERENIEGINKLRVLIIH